MILLYVSSPAASAAFYARLLGHEPVEQSPTFAMLALNSATMLGLWGVEGVAPKAATTPGANELAIVCHSRADVDDTCATWRAAGIPIALTPTQLDFGYTCVGLDPDGHRLRLFCPEENG
jgi:catechol 2,3-dioxygenase-like lactoylglutathione lyase family enzyme